MLIAKLIANNIENVELVIKTLKLCVLPSFPEHHCNSTCLKNDQISCLF